MPDIRLNAKNKTITLRKSTNAITLKQVGRRGIKGDKGDQGDPATNLVQSVNGKQGVVVLNASDVGADPTGSASQALQDAKDYTDSEVSTLDSSLATVAKTGSYNDLSDKPTIPSITGLATETQVQDVQDNLDAHEADTANPHNVTKAQVGLGNVDNTSDANKPVSTATQTALNGKVNSRGAGSTSRMYSVNTAGVDGEIAIAAGSAAVNTAAVRDGAGAIHTATATAATHAVNKAQMDTADALKVNKAGDTMTGKLNAALSVGDVAYSQDRAGTKIKWGVGSNAVFGVYNETAGTEFINIKQNELRIGNQSATALLVGTGFPNGVVTAPVGSTYIDTAATSGAIEWKKATGTGNTGWVVSVGDTGWRNVASGLINGWSVSVHLRIRRVGNQVFFKADGLTASAMTNTAFYYVTDGFRHITASAPNERGLLHTAGGPATIYRTVLDASFNLSIGNSSTATPTLYGSISWSSEYAWPTTLPGTAA